MSQLATVGLGNAETKSDMSGLGSSSSSSSSSMSVTATDTRRPRLIITNMVLQDFKSYGGRKEIGPFHKSFSSVIGPNGSGKSNVIDAMLFVFGKRAKEIRLKNLSELIHRSALRKNAEQCSVTVYFAEILDHATGSGYDVIPGSEFSIRRTAKLDNSSQYYIGEKASSFSEVTSLLRQKQIDLDHNRFLILQGEVEAIAMMKPIGTHPNETGLLEYLEDIIGTSRYIPAIEEEQKKYEALSKTVTIECERLRRCDGALNNLKKVMDDVKLCLHADIKCEVIKKRLAIWRQFAAQRQKENLLEQSKERITKLERLEASRADKMQAKEYNAKNIQDWYKKNNDLGDEIAKYQKEIGELDRKDAELRENYGDRSRALTANKAKLKKAQADREALQAAVTRDREALPRLQAEIVDLQKQEAEAIAELERRVEANKGKTEAHRKKLEEKQAELLPLETLKTEAMRKRKDCENELRVLRDQRDAVTKRRDALEQELKDAKKRAADNITVYKAAEGRIRALETEYKTVEQKLEQITQQRQVIAAQAQELTVKSTQMREAMGAVQNRGAIVAQLMKKKKEDPANFKGVFGVLGDLGSISEDYDVAISTAAPQLRHIVTDTTRTAQNCLSFIREQRLGTATFICLDKMHELYRNASQQPFQAPAGSQRLLDLITTEDRFKPAFYHALRDTLVTDTLEAATSISFSGNIRRRVVTLRGELVEPHGAMSGGGTRTERGAMKLNSSSSRGRGQSNPSRIDDSESKDQTYTEAEVQAVEHDRQTKLSQLADIDRTISQLNAQAEKLRSDTMDVKVRAQRIHSNQPALDGQVTALEQDLDQDLKSSQAEEKQALVADARIVELEANLQGLQQEEAKASVATARFESELQEIKRVLMAAGGVELKQLKDAATKIKHQRESKQNELARTTAAAEGAAAKLTRFDELERSITKENELLQAECASITERIAKIEAQAMEVMTKLQNSERILKEQKEIVRGLEDDQARLEEELRRIASDIEAVKREIDGIKRAVKQQEENLKREVENIEEAKQEIKKLQLQLTRTEENLTPSEEQYVKNKAKRELQKERLQALLEAKALLQQQQAQAGAEAAPTSDAVTALTMEEDEIRQSLDVEDEKTDLPPVEDVVDLGEGEEAEKPAEHEEIDDEDIQREIRAMQSDNRPSGDLEARRIAELENELRSAEAESRKLAVNLKQIQEYRKQLLEVQVHALLRSIKEGERDRQREKYDNLRKQRLNEFSHGFRIISKKLKEIYQMLTKGGDAELELKDSNPFAEGIEFSVRPLNKTWKRIQNLSGGEKTLSSLALVFALHHYKPTPLYVMDEIDAALDRLNVSIVAKYIQQRTTDAQFIVISLRNNMFERADRLVGIYKTQNITKSVTIDPRSFATDTAAESGGSNKETSGTSGL